MNLLLLTGIAACGVLLLWTTQSVALAAIGEPLTWPLRTRTDDVRVKWTRRVGVQAVWALLLAGFPWAAGSSPAQYFARVFPPPDWAFLAQTGALCLALMFAAYVIEVRVGWVRWAPQYTGPVRRAKLFRRFLTPVPLAIVEEAVFRGTLLEQIAGALPDGRAGAMAAIVASSVVFSLVHFVRPDDERPFWQPALGLFLFGVVCGMAYIGSGHTLWLPVVIHAAGIFVTETTRLYTVFRGPPLMVGYACFPHCGLIGATTLALLATLILLPL